MKNNSFDENSMDINNNPEGQGKKILINSQEELVEHLKNAHNHEVVYIGGTSWDKYLIFNDDNRTIRWVKLFDMLCDGVINRNAITNLDEILEYKDVIEDFDNLRKFLYWFYERDFNGKNIGNYELVEKGYCFASKTELENAVSAFNTEQLKQNPTKYVINLAQQKNSLKKEDYTPEDPLENYLLGKSIDDITYLENLLNEGQKIPWSKLAPALRNRSIKELNTLKEMAVFGKNNKIDGMQTLLFANKSVGNWQELFEMCDDKTKHDFIFYEADFAAFKDGAFKDFDLNNTQTLQEYGLIKQSRFKYPLYVLWDIGRIIVWAVSCGNWCKYERKDDDWFEKTGKLYEKNCDIEDAIKRIKENQEKKPVSEQPKENEIGEDKNQTNIELIKPKTESSLGKSKNENTDTSSNLEDMKW